jgi:hypothetical protein
MRIGLHPARAFIALALVGVFCGACSKDSNLRPTTAPQSMDTALGAPSSGAGLSAASTRTAASTAGSTNGAAGEMPAFYDGQQFTINSVELPGGASASTIASNQSLNQIYATNDLDDPQDFFPVLSAIQGDGFNPLWQQFLIVFNPGVTPHQFHSDDEVLDAASGAHPEITLITTDEVYRCAVVGKK